MANINKEEMLLKLNPYGVKSMSALNRLIREQQLPVKYISPRRVFFDEAEVDIWLSRRYEGVVRANANHAKVLRQQRKMRRERTIQASVETDTTPAIAAFKAKEA